MVTKALFMRSIQQKDNHTFTIEWMDGEKIDYRLSDLQKRCPCAHCIDEKNKESKHSLPAVDEDVRALKLQTIGSYALKINFTSGCSEGIYSFDMLKKWNL